jgi:hypothetical protein
MTREEMSRSILHSCAHLRKQVEILQPVKLRPNTKSTYAPIDYLQKSTILVIKHFVIST